MQERELKRTLVSYKIGFSFSKMKNRKLERKLKKLEKELKKSWNLGLEIKKIRKKKRKLEENKKKKY